jgi:hypothetical protein
VGVHGGSSYTGGDTAHGTPYRRGIAGALPSPVVRSLDPFEASEEWRLAVLTVTLVLVGLDDAPDAPGRVTGPTRPRAERPAASSPGRRHVRPPRSC